MGRRKGLGVPGSEPVALGGGEEGAERPVQLYHLPPTPGPEARASGQGSTVLHTLQNSCRAETSHVRPNTRAVGVTPFRGRPGGRTLTLSSRIAG